MQSKTKSLPKFEITKITISQNTKKKYGKPIEQLSLKRWPLSYLNIDNYYLDTQNVKQKQSTETDIKINKHKELNQKYRIGTVSDVTRGFKLVCGLQTSPSTSVMVQ